MRTEKLAAFAFVVLSAVGTVSCGGGGAAATQPATPKHAGTAEQVGPGAKRTILHKKKLDECQGREAVLSYVEYLPNAESGKHYHSGPELVYVISGSVTIEPEGGQPTTLEAGGTYFNAPKAVHNVKNPHKSVTATFVSYLLNEEGALLATPVK